VTRGDRVPTSPRHERYRPLSGRRRLLVLVLAVSTAITVVWMLFERPGGPQWKGKPPRADAARCTPGQTRDCVGGQADVIVAPPTSGAAGSGG
jgi:hypothetical protein